MIDVSNVPLLLVVVPIIAATLPLLIGLRRDSVGWTVATIVCGGLVIGSLVLAWAVYIGDSTIFHRLGGFDRPVGIELVADRFSTAIGLLVTTVSFAVLAFTRLGGPRGNTFYAGYLLLVGGLLGITFTGDVFNLFVFLEITGLATYGLIAKNDSGKAAYAALKYLILGTLGASIYLLGVGFLYLATGTLNMIDLSQELAMVGYDEPLILAGFTFIVVGFSIKVAQWPVHTWQPDAYQHAPDGVTPLIAALVSTISAYALGRVLYTVFTVDFLQSTPFAANSLVVIGSVSVVAGSVLAVMQWDLKRMLAYSSVSQFGLIVAAYGLVTETAFLGAMIHLVGHGLLKVGLFIGVGIVAFTIGVRTIDEYAGVARQQPFVAGALALLGIALIGIPPSVGFLGKWYIAVGSVEAALWPVAAIIFLSTMLTLAYVAKIGEKMYFQTEVGASHTVRSTPLLADGGTTESIRASFGMKAVLIVVAVIAIMLGFGGAGFDAAFGPFVEEVFNG